MPSARSMSSRRARRGRPRCASARRGEPLECLSSITHLARRPQETAALAFSDRHPFLHQRAPGSGRNRSRLVPVQHAPLEAPDPPDAMRDSVMRPFRCPREPGARKVFEVDAGFPSSGNVKTRARTRHLASARPAAPRGGDGRTVPRKSSSGGHASGALVRPVPHEAQDHGHVGGCGTAEPRHHRSLPHAGELSGAGSLAGCVKIQRPDVEPLRILSYNVRTSPRAASCLDPHGQRSIGRGIASPRRCGNPSACRGEPPRSAHVASADEPRGDALESSCQWTPFESWTSLSVRLYFRAHATAWHPISTWWRCRGHHAAARERHNAL